MTRPWVWLSAFLSVGFALGGSLAHLYELPHKIHLSSEDYLTVQQIYRGWALLGVVILGAVLSTAAHLTVLHLRRQPWLLAAVGLACLITGQAVFWAFTFPANQETSNWTMLPNNWTHLRAQWEYSHAAGALLNLSAFLALLFGASRRGDAPSKRF